MNGDDEMSRLRAGNLRTRKRLPALRLPAGCARGGAQKNTTYTLVLTAADFNDANLSALLQEAAGCTPDEANDMRTRTLVALKSGLSYDDCAALKAPMVEGASKLSSFSIVSDYEAGDLSHLPPSNTKKAPRALTFWPLVGAILMALLLWTIATLIVGLMLTMGVRY